MNKYLTLTFILLYSSSAFAIDKKADVASQYTTNVSTFSTYNFQRGDSSGCTLARPCRGPQKPKGGDQ